MMPASRSRPWIWFQPTRPHEARLDGARERRAEREVSTHAPTRGATQLGAGVGDRVRSVSTHAPTRGATDDPLSSLEWVRSFQPTRPHEARPLAERGERVAVVRFNPRAHTRRDPAT